MIRGTGSRRKGKRGPRTKADEIAAELSADHCDPARIRELYYWSREPGFLEIVRTLATLPEPSRAAVETFVSIAQDPSSITATWDVCGRLTLASPQVAHAIAIVQHCAESEDGNEPKLLN